ncbi:hypothetical protein MMC12_006576 [Toensbergia leucococca]|nr:hypothetical protein [Toensbergia leucococca]
MPAANETGAKSGIITSSSGERHIPPSVRPDGSKRKEIKIRPGYKPPEDVEVYKNRTAEAWKTKGTGGIPGAVLADENGGNGDSKTSNKNAKRREARKKAKALEETEFDTDGQVKLSTWADRVPSNHPALDKENWRALAKEHDPELQAEPDSEAEKEKQARTLKKKLRQARELREKKNKGENLLPEQFEKVIKINELIRQLDSLGFDAEGQPKEA